MTHRESERACAYPIVAGLLLASALGMAEIGHAAAWPGSVSRGDIVAAVEQGPGPTKGSADAPVVMVEFSDFQCGYCRLFWRETLPKIEEQYIRTQKVRFIYRHMAIRGEGSVLAARAASCAHDQGKFWQYHDALWGKGMPLAFTSARLKSYAAELHLDEGPFADCLDSGKHAELVETETTWGYALRANGTPSFLMNGHLVIGAYPFEAFQRALDELLTAPSGRTK